MDQKEKYFPMEDIKPPVSKCCGAEIVDAENTQGKDIEILGTVVKANSRYKQCYNCGQILK